MRTTVDFAINQRTAPLLPFADFLALNQRLGCIGVEARNDLGRPFFDGLPAKTAGQMARDAGLRLLGLSEVYPFDDWTTANCTRVQELLDAAHEAQAETISLIPRVDGLGPSDPSALHRDILADLLQMAEGSGVVPLIEPIGFPACSIRLQQQIVGTIETVGGAGRLGIVHDTFQHTLAGDEDYFVDHIWMVHISGAEPTGSALTHEDDGNRLLLDRSDTTGAVAQIRLLLERGYSGAFSYECTTPAVQHSATLERDIIASMA